MTIDRRAILLALFPLVITLLAVLATAAFGLSIPRIEALIDRPNVQFGYFAEQFPLLAYGVIYTLARLMVVTITAGKPWSIFRPILWVLAAVVVLAAASYPNFGGVIARAGFALGGISLISSIPPVCNGLLAGRLPGPCWRCSRALAISLSIGSGSPLGARLSRALRADRLDGDGRSCRHALAGDRGRRRLFPQGPHGPAGGGGHLRRAHSRQRPACGGERLHYCRPLAPAGLRPAGRRGG